MLYYDEQLLKYATAPADVRDGVDAHAHTMYREPRQALSMGSDNCFAEIVAQSMPDMATDCRDVESLKRRVGEKVEYVLLPFQQRGVLIHSKGDRAKPR